MDYYDFLGFVHEAMQPASYLEIGVASGRSFTLARCPAVGVDPAFRVVHPLGPGHRLLKETSDHFFEREEARRFLPDGGVELAFIDGMHLFEYVLRDFIQVERRMAPGGVVVFHDVFPRDDVEASRRRVSPNWAGDVWKILPCLAFHRPDLVLVPVDVHPTGLLLVFGLDPGNGVLTERQAEIESRFLEEEMQFPPSWILEKRGAFPAQEVMRSGLFQALATRGETGPGDVAVRTLGEAGIQEVTALADHFSRQAGGGGGTPRRRARLAWSAWSRSARNGWNCLAKAVGIKRAA